MPDDEQAYLDKATESLLGAVSEHAGGRYNNCANRCYYASFQAAVHALEQEGVRYSGSAFTWAHEALQATFARELVMRRKVYQRELRDVLTRNESLRESADYDRHWVTEGQAGRALRRTQALVDAVKARAGARR